MLSVIAQEIDGFARKSPGEPYCGECGLILNQLIKPVPFG
jgi:hypothetical protein